MRRFLLTLLIMIMIPYVSTLAWTGQLEGVRKRGEKVTIVERENKNIPIAGKLYTEQFGTYQCMKEIRNELIKECKVKVPDEIIEEVIRNGNAEIDDKYINVIKRIATDYTDKVFRKLREYGYCEDFQKLYFVGGGACLIKNFVSYNAERVVIIDDICATAKGYEYLMSQKLYRKAV